MSYSACDLADDVVGMLSRKGYTVHDDDTGWWFVWGHPTGSSGYEVGETVGEEMAAWADALCHYMNNTDIKMEWVAG